MPITDFRAVRRVLEPDDFALGSDEPDPSPSDLISKKTWNGIVTLGDDVAIRTSDHNGKVLGEVYWLWGEWIKAVGEQHDSMFNPMLDATDDLQVSFFCALHGYYRAAFGALRNVLELMAIGSSISVLNDKDAYDEWRSGAAELSFGRACDRLASTTLLRDFNESLRSQYQRSLFEARDPKRGHPGGYIREWYTTLCAFAHSRPGFAHGDLWRSNGPIYVPRVFWKWYLAYLQTVSISAILLKLARPKSDSRQLKKLFTDDPDVIPGILKTAFTV